MGLNASSIISILQNLIGGKIVDTPLGNGLSINPRDAFLFSSIAGGSYFENQIFPFTPKGLLKVFYNAHDYNLVTGIFDNAILKTLKNHFTFSLFSLQPLRRPTRAALPCATLSAGQWDTLA